MSKTPLVTEVIVGVDTHKHVHAAVAISALGARLGSTTIPAGVEGYRQMEVWARSFGTIRAFGVEGTGSYGAGLSRFLHKQSHTVLEVNHPNRQLRKRPVSHAEYLLDVHGRGEGPRPGSLFRVGRRRR